MRCGLWRMAVWAVGVWVVGVGVWVCGKFRAYCTTGTQYQKTKNNKAVTRTYKLSNRGINLKKMCTTNKNAAVWSIPLRV